MTTIATNGLYFPATDKVHGGRAEIRFWREMGGYCACVWIQNSWNNGEGFNATEHNYIWAETSEGAVARATAFGIREGYIALEGWALDLQPKQPEGRLFIPLYTDAANDYYDDED